MGATVRASWLPIVPCWLLTPILSHFTFEDVLGLICPVWWVRKLSHGPHLGRVPTYLQVHVEHSVLRLMPSPFPLTWEQRTLSIAGGRHGDPPWVLSLPGKQGCVLKEHASIFLP